MFTTRVERNFEAAHTNGPPEGRCATMHGHSWNVTVEVNMNDNSLDEWGWSIDFTALKRIIDQYDHKTLNGMPGLDKPSAEHVAMQIWKDVMTETDGRAFGCEVTISEGHGNTLVYDGPDDYVEFEKYAKQGVDVSGSVKLTPQACDCENCNCAR